MPDYQPSEWNDDPVVTKINNCYNYATNKKNVKPAAGQKMPVGAEPGKSKKVSARQYKGHVKVDGQVLPLFDYECEGLKTACKLDGLDDPKAGNTCEAGCWLIAAYVRRLDVKKKLFGDFHFLRQDSNGKWSHKPGDGPVTNQKYNKKTNKYDGGEITDPAKDPVGIGPYVLCGYFCVCPDAVTVAAAPPLNQTGEGDGVTVTLGGSLGAEDRYSTATAADAILAAADDAAVSAELQWIEGMGGGELEYRIDMAGDRTLFGTSTSLSIWDSTTLRHLDDPGGVASAQIGRMLGLCPPGAGVLWDGVAEQAAPQLPAATVTVEKSSEGLARAALIASVSIPVALVVAALLLS